MKTDLLFLLSKCQQLTICMLLLAFNAVSAQCLPGVLCQPGNAPAANAVFGMGIFRVTLAGLDTITNGSVDGYQDYGCRSRVAQLIRGASYTLTVNTNPNADEIVRAWIDYDQDGAFATNELVLLSAPGKQHAATFTVPASALTGVPLRLRIAADYSNASVPTACSTPQYSQTEDYRVRVASSPPPRPQIRFMVSDTVTCAGTVTFRDQSLNLPTAWHWTFGDGTTSAQQHPQHTYSQPGTYAVSLQACNASGCDSLTKSRFVLVRSSTVRAAPCQPATVAYCCDFGMTRFRLANLNHSSAGGTAGYQDFSCPQQATVMADHADTLSITSGINPQDVRIYLDLNEDGQFDPVAERIYQGLAVRNPSFAFTVAATPSLVYNRPLRLRVWLDAAGTAFAGPCTAPQSGQVVDYGLVVLPNTVRPTAAFAVGYQQLCNPVRLAVTNQTSGGATSYAWSFGDGGTSSLISPPVHIYTTPGLYEIQLIARNSNGADTVRQRIAVATCPATYCTAGGLGGTNTSPASFTRVQLGTIDNVAARSYGTGYYDFTTLYTELRTGQTYPLRAESLPWQFAGAGPWAQIAAWIDFNQDGQFSPSEMIGPSTSYSPYQLTVRVPHNAKLGTTRLRVLIQNEAAPVGDDSCTPAFRNASTEDYSLVILPALTAPVAGFEVDLATSCTGIVQFRDTSWAGPSQWQWNFGDGSTSTAQHPQHRFTAPGTYSVSLLASNRFGRSQANRSNYVMVSGISTGPHPAACLPLQGNTDYYYGIGQLTIGTSFTYSQPPAAAGYLDLTCSLPPIRLVRGLAVPVSFASVRAGSASPNGIYNVRMWLDWNDNGLFEPGSELVYSSGPYGTIQTGTIVLPAAIPVDQTFRLRVQYNSGDSAPVLASLSDPCYRHESVGQIRDFAVVVSATSPTAAAQGRNVSNWQVFPNPSNGLVMIQGALSQSTSITLYNMLGQQVWQRRIGPNATGKYLLDLQAIPPAVYIMRIGGNGAVIRLVLN